MADTEFTGGRGPVAWMARNSVAANLLMIVILAGGIFGVLSIKQEVFPEFDLDMVVIQVPYPGASPTEVEQGIVLAVEEAVSGIDGVKEVTSTSSEGMASVSVELLLGASTEVVLADVTAAVDRITTFPEDAEEPVVSLASMRRHVVSLIISGDLDRRTLHDIAERARSELLTNPGITQVELEGVRPLEISIELPRESLEAYGLTLDEVAMQIRAASIELPGGGLETRGGEILVRMADRRLRGEQFADIVIRGTELGYDLRLGDIATITDGYADTDQDSYFNGERAVRLTAYRVGDETPASVSAVVREYSEQLRAELPDSVTLTTWSDSSRVLNERIELLVKNAVMGFALVLIILGLFLRPSLAGWIALGIPISFFGAFAVMSPQDISVNMISLFALIVTLGLVVDDAIIVGENTFTKIEKGVPRLQAAIEGAGEMLKPVAFSILTTLTAFAPMFFVPGVMGKIFFLFPAVVSSVLIFSWLESFLILPAHLGHGKKQNQSTSRRINRIPDAVSRGLGRFIGGVYEPFLQLVLRYRYITVSIGLGSFVLAVVLVASGVLPFSFFPKIDGEVITATARLPYGAPIEQTLAVRDELESAARRAVEQHGGDAILEGMFTRVGEGPASRMAAAETGSHLVTIELGLVRSAEREVTAETIADAWEEGMPVIPGVESMTFSYDTGPGHGAAIDVQLEHRDSEVLVSASEELTRSLRGYRELINVRNAWSSGKPQLDFQLLPEARSLGLTSTEVGRQIRSAFYGAEALREQRGRNELKVMVRLPESQRRSERDLEQLEIRTPGGGQIPLEQVALFVRGRAPSSISHNDGERVVNVTAELAPGVPSSRPLLESLDSEVLPALAERYPGLTAEFVGQQQDQAETFASLGKSFLFALFVIYALLAIPFRSYTQPVIIMSAIPLGFVGAVVGHLVMGYGMSLMSVFGLVALAGVVVNNSLVLIDSTNKAREEGRSAWESIIYAGKRRFRPILLTSLTTFFGLAPMIFETSVQAKFLIPMAISLGFGILFSVGVGLLFVPALYLILEDGLKLVKKSEDEPEEQLLESEGVS